MAKRTFEFHCHEGLGEALVEVIKVYIDAAYPPGGSSCAAATREAFETLNKKLASSETVAISTRQRPMLKSAVNWFYKESGREDDPVYAKLLEELGKKGR